MKYLLLVLLIPSVSFSKEVNLSSIFVTNKNSFQYYDIDFYDELDSYLPVSTNNQHEKKPKPITPVPKDVYNISNYSNINKFFIDIQDGNNYEVLSALSNHMHPDVRNINDIDNGMTPLLVAASTRRILIIKTLLLEGADPNLSTHILGISNITPLMVASQQGPLEVVEKLVKYGAIVNAETVGVVSGNTALMVAVKNQHEDIVKFLLSKHADVNTLTTSEGINNINALMIASQTGNLEIVKQLVQVPNIDLHIADSEGKNALVYAYISGNIELISFLISLGIKTTLKPNEIRKIIKDTLTTS